jgi:glyoxylase-like metal-dependent hydrolase (beta-lactamase superfamily II)
MDYEVTHIKGGFENAYLLTGGRVALVDTLAPTGYRKLENALNKQGLAVSDVELILITHHHFDHVGNLAKIKVASGATVIAGEADAPFIDGSTPLPPVSDLNRLGRLLRRLPDSWIRSYQRFTYTGVDRTVRGGEIIDELDLEVVPLPGHTPGGVGFLDRDAKQAFIGDLVSYFFGRLGMPTLSASESLEQIFASQKLLAGLGLETAYPGHGRIIESGASKMIGDYNRKKCSRLMK